MTATRAAELVGVGLLLGAVWNVNVPRINNWLIRRRVMAMLGIGKRRR